MGGSAKGERPILVGPMGELTDVASAKRAALGVLTDRESDELDDRRGRTVVWISFSSSMRR